jgi:bacterioferritin
MTKENLIRGLNEDLAAEWGTIIRYTYQASRAVGLRGAEFRSLLEKEIPDELGHAKFLSDVIFDLGGEPTTKPRAFETTGDLRAMVELDLKMESQDVENYTEHARLAEQLGETELKVKLENMAADESRHARDLRRILRGLES